MALNPFVAESYGYGTGLDRGVAIGQADGYTQGWNDCIARQTPRVNEAIAEWKNALNEALVANHKFHEANQGLGKRRDALLAQINQMHSDYELLHQSFLGLISMLEPLLKASGNLSFDLRNKIFDEYADLAIELQSDPYVEENGFPHRQVFIKQYIPIATDVFASISRERRQRRELLQKEKLAAQNQITPDQN